MIKDIKANCCLYRLRCLVLVVAMLVAGVVTSCRTSRYGVDDVVEPSSSGLSLDERISRAIKAEGEWNKIQFPVKISLTSPTKFSMSGRAYFERDKMIHLSMRFLGMEVATLTVANDSIKFVDKYHRNYVAESVSSLTGGVPLSVGEVQRAILGCPFVSGTKQFDHKAVRQARVQTDSNGGWSLSSQDKALGASYIFKYDNESVSPSSFTVKIGSRKVSLFYSSPEQTACGVFAGRDDLKAEIDNKPLNISIISTFKSLKTSFGDQIGVESVKGYERLDFRQLLKSFK